MPSDISPMDARPFELRGWLARWASLTAALAIPATYSLGRFDLRSLLALALIAALTVLLGCTLGILLRLPQTPGFMVATETVLGFCALSALQLTVTSAFRLDAVPGLAFSGLAIIALFAAKGRRPAAEPDRARRARSGMEGGFIVALSCLITLWAREPLIVVRRARESGQVLLTWTDFFVHAVQIDYLGHASAFAGHSLLLAGARQIIYHEGSYSLAAAYSGLSGRTSFESVTAFWVPAGLVLMGLGVYGLASALSGRRAGAIAALALFLLPDASGYGVQNSYFSFQLVSEVCAASGYGVALVLVALGIFVLGFPAARNDLVFLSAGVAASSALFKVQTAFPAIPLFTLLFLAGWRPRQRWRYWATVALGVGLAAAASLLFERIALAPHFLTGRNEALRFLAFAHAHAPPRFAQFYAAIAAGSPAWRQGVLGTGLLLAAAFGAFLPALILVSIWPRRPRRAWPIEIIPYALIGGYLATVFLVPSPITGDFTEYGQRPLVVVYAALVALVIAETASGLRRRLLPLWLRQAAPASGALLAAALALSQCRPATEPQHHMLGMENVVGASLPPGLFEAADYIRHHAQIEDWVLSSDGDPSALIACLTERAAYLTRFRLIPVTLGPAKAIATARFNQGAALQKLRTYEALQAFGREQHVRWFLLQPGDMSGWPQAMLDQCRFQSGAVRVFELTAAGPPPLLLFGVQ